MLKTCVTVEFSRFPQLCPPLSRPLAHNGEAAWRRRGEHNRFTESQTVNFPDAVSQSYTPACAKPRVSSSLFWSFLFIFIQVEV